MSKPHKLFIFFGADIINYGQEFLKDAYSYDYTLMPLDGPAVGFVDRAGLPFTLLDEYLGINAFQDARAQAFYFEENWFKPVREAFTVAGNCWPELDRDAMFWFWRDAALTIKLAETFLENGGTRLKLFQSRVLRPALYYYRSDIHAVILNSLLAGKTHPVVMPSAFKNSCEYSFYDQAITFDTPSRNQNELDYGVLADKIVFALNPGEFHRFKTVFDQLSENFPGKLSAVILYPDQALARNLTTRYHLPVVCPSRADGVDFSDRHQFEKGFSALSQSADSNDRYNLFSILRYHFTCHYNQRWPSLQADLKAWHGLWGRHLPRTVIVSNLTDCESQLPAEAANQHRIATFSIPHGAWGVNKTAGVSKHVLYNFPLQKILYDKKGFATDRLKRCRNITTQNEYPVVTQNAFPTQKTWRILALTDPVFIEGCMNTFLEPMGQLEALRILANPPMDLARRICLRIKVHPGYPNLELPGLVSAVFAQKVLPTNSELEPIAAAADLILAVNYVGAAIIHVLRLGKPIIFLWTERLVGATNKCDMGHILSVTRAAGIVVEKAEDLWQKIGEFFTDSQVSGALCNRAKTFSETNFGNHNFPQLVDILKDQILPEKQAPAVHREAADLTVQTRSNGITPMEPVSEESDQNANTFKRVTKKTDAAQIKNIDADPSYYYGEIPKDDFYTILERGKQNGNIEFAIAEYCQQTNNRYFKEYALDPRRALCLKLFGDLKGKRVLDYGCGLGSLGILAAKMGAHVTFVDSCLARLQTAHARAEQHSLGNTAFFACKNWNSLPADFDPFDAILLNGILEWVPTASGCTFDTVLDTQLDFLKKMRQLLRPGGRVLLAIENRFALQYFMGYPEDHTDIQYLSLMNREKANALHRQEKGDDYLAWTWGLEDYEKLLPKAGLKMAEAYAIFPDYRFPRLIVSLDDKQGLKKGMLMENYEASQELKERFIDYIYEMGIIERFVYSYCLVLEKGHSKP